MARFGLVVVALLLPVPALADWGDARVDVWQAGRYQPRLISGIGKGEYPLHPTIRFATPGISESYPGATGLTLEGVVRMGEERTGGKGGEPVFFELGRIIVPTVAPELRAAVRKALDRGTLRVSLRAPDAAGMGELVLTGDFAIRTVGQRQLGHGFAVPQKIQLGRTLLRVPVNMKDVRGVGGRTLTFHSGAHKTPVGPTKGR